MGIRKRTSTCVAALALALAFVSLPAQAAKLSDVADKAEPAFQDLNWMLEDGDITHEQFELTRLAKKASPLEERIQAAKTLQEDTTVPYEVRRWAMLHRADLLKIQGRMPEALAVGTGWLEEHPEDPMDADLRCALADMWIYNAVEPSYVRRKSPVPQHPKAELLRGTWDDRIAAIRGLCEPIFTKVNPCTAQYVRSLLFYAGALEYCGPRAAQQPLSEEEAKGLSTGEQWLRSRQMLAMYLQQQVELMREALRVLELCQKSPSLTDDREMHGMLEHGYPERIERRLKKAEEQLAGRQAAVARDLERRGERASTETPTERHIMFPERTDAEIVAIAQAALREEEPVRYPDPAQLDEARELIIASGATRCEQGEDLGPNVLPRKWTP